MKKQGDRGREAAQLLRVKTLLNTTKKIDTLEEGEYNSLQPFTASFSSSGGKATLTLPLGCIAVRFLGGVVPDRGDQPTEVLQGGKRPRKEQVAAGRAVVTRLFDVIGKCMGYTTRPPPKRELFLEEGTEYLVFPFDPRRADSFGGSNPIPSLSTTVANEIERRMMLQPPGSQGSGGQGGNYMTQ